MTSFGLIALGQLQPINRPVSTFSPYGRILSQIFSRCGHLSSISGASIWSRLDGMLCRAYAFGSSTWMRLSRRCTTRPPILSTVSFSRPSMVLRLKLVWTPFMSRSCCTWVVMKVVSLASSRSAYTLTPFSGLSL